MIFVALLVFAAGNGAHAAELEIPDDTELQQQLDPGLCQAGQDCKRLMGATGGEQPRLADLIVDILMILDADEHKWMKKKDRPPATVTLRLANFLRWCLRKALSLKNFLTQPCLAKTAPTQPEIIDMPIPWDERRERLMSEYMRDHVGDPSTRLNAPTTVVTHWTGSSRGSAKSTFNTFAPTALTGRVRIKKAGTVNVSCHFLVERDGTIYRFMPEDKAARHTVGLNASSLCIENLGGPGAPLTEAQEKSNANLIHYLIGKYPTVESVVGHSEYRGFENTYVFRELDAKYRSDREDEPGRKFLRNLRRDLASPDRCRGAAQ